MVQEVYQWTDNSSIFDTFVLTNSCNYQLKLPQRHKTCKTAKQLHYKLEWMSWLKFPVIE